MTSGNNKRGKNIKHKQTRWSVSVSVRQEEKIGRNQEIRGSEAGTGFLPTGCLLNKHKEKISPGFHRVRRETQGGCKRCNMTYKFLKCLRKSKIKKHSLF